MNAELQVIEAAKGWIAEINLPGWTLYSNGAYKSEDEADRKSRALAERLGLTIAISDST